MLYDDTALSIELASGRVFSEESDQLLRRLETLCEAAQLDGKPSEVMVTPEWREIASMARAALRSINAR
jgi:hypothetical protein